MGFKLMFTLTVTFFAILCLTQKTTGKPFDTDTLDDLKGDDVVDTQVGRTLSKRNIPTRALAVFEYCLTRGRFDIGCRQRYQPQRPTIQLIED